MKSLSRLRVLLDAHDEVPTAVAEAIRANPAWQDIPVIAMTANAMATDREKVLEAGMCDHIAKPLNVATMFATMARWIKPRQAGKAAL